MVNPTTSSQSALSRYGVEPAPQKHDPVYDEFENLRSDAAGTDFQEVADRLSTWSLDDLHTDEYPKVEGFSYEVPEEKGPATVAELWRLDPKSYWDGDYDHENIPSTAGVVVNNADEYVQEFALDSLDFAEYYSQMDGLPYQFRYSADYRTHLSPYFVRKLVRLANGKGRIDVEKTELILCGTGSVIAAGPRGVFWAEIPSVTVHGRDATPLPDPPEAVIHEIGGLEIPEENPRLRAALEQMLEFTTHPELPRLDTHQGLSASHEFRTQDGATVVVDENSLRLLRNSTNSVSEVTGTYETYAGGDDRQIDVESADCPAPVGEFTELPVDERKVARTGVQQVETRCGVIGGYWVDWREKSPGFGSETVSAVIPQLQTVLIRPDLTAETVSQQLATIDIN